MILKSGYSSERYSTKLRHISRYLFFAEIDTISTSVQIAEWLRVLLAVLSLWKQNADYAVFVIL